MHLTADFLRSSLDTHAAFRRRRRLQPIEGAGAKIFPPTYPGNKKDVPQHVFERRRINGQDVWAYSWTLFNLSPTGSRNICWRPRGKRRLSCLMFRSIFLKRNLTT